MNYEVSGCGETATVVADAPILAAELIANCFFDDDETPMQLVIEKEPPVGTLVEYAVFDRAGWRKNGMAIVVRAVS